MRDKRTPEDRAFQRLIDERAALRRELAVAIQHGNESWAADLRARIASVDERINQRLREAAKEDDSAKE
jgi:hypothetical protein